MATKVFMSYSNSDVQLALEVSAALKSADITVEDDHSALQPGDVWAAKLGAAIDDSDVVIVLVSKESSESAWVYTELAKAFESKKVIVPILSNREVEIPPLLAPFQYVDISDEGARTENLLRLGRQLAGRDSESSHLERDYKLLGDRLYELRKVRAACDAAQIVKFFRISRLASLIAVVLASLSAAAATISFVTSESSSGASLTVAIAGLGLILTLAVSIGSVLQGEVRLRSRRPTEDREPQSEVER